MPFLGTFFCWISNFFEHFQLDSAIKKWMEWNYFHGHSMHFCQIATARYPKRQKCDKLQYLSTLIFSFQQGHWLDSFHGSLIRAHLLKKVYRNKISNFVNCIEIAIGWKAQTGPSTKYSQFILNFVQNCPLVFVYQGIRSKFSKFSAAYV